MRLALERYPLLAGQWPPSGKHILAQYDDHTIVVYQAYRPEVGEHVAAHGQLGGPHFSFDRMSWIKPNFLWMMFRSGWGTKEGQEVTLAVRIQRAGFDAILAEAVHSRFLPDVYPDRDVWREAVERSSVRLQWDPDHDPHGLPIERRAIQLGLRSSFLLRYARDWLVDIDDISPFVAEQRERLRRGEEILTPAERVYPAPSAVIAARLGLAPS